MSVLTVSNHRSVWNVSCFNPKLHLDPNHLDSDALLLTIRVCKALILLVIALATIAFNSLMVLVLQVRINIYNSSYFSKEKTIFFNFRIKATIIMFTFRSVLMLIFLVYIMSYFLNSPGKQKVKTIHILFWKRDSSFGS